MAQIHFIYMRHAIGSLTHDAIMAEAKRYGVETPKRFLNMIVASEINRMVDRFKEGLSDEELEAYQYREANLEYNGRQQIEARSTDLDEEIPF